MGLQPRIFMLASRESMPRGLTRVVAFSNPPREVKKPGLPTPFFEECLTDGD